MKKYLPIIFTLMLMLTLGYIVVSKKNKKIVLTSSSKKENVLGTFTKQESCAILPHFFKRLHIPQPVMIDLSQKRFKGIALLYGKEFKKVLHPKIWEKYEHFSTYTIDTEGNIYLVPTPFISILPTTFNLQKNIYKLDSKTGKISIFMHFDDIVPTAINPYGLNAITYDCEDKTIWIAAIDESNYQEQKGVIYHINPKTKEILQKVEGFDVLSMTIIKSKKNKYLLVGSARDNGLYAYKIINAKLSSSPYKLLELPSANEHIRKIKVTSKNRLELQSIPFSYTLITQTAKKDRIFYDAIFNTIPNIWKVNIK
jgi:hypothetical protein